MKPSFPLAVLALSLSALAQRPVEPRSGPVAPPVSAAPRKAHDATSFPGRDIGAQINAALEDCKRQCTVHVPEGSYSFETTIHLPLMSFGMYSLVLDPGTVLTYTGPEDAIAAPSNGLTRANLVIEGGQLAGTPRARAGIHTFPTNKVTIREMTVRNFSSGDGIHIDGTNTVLLLDDDLTLNRVGLHLTGTRCAGNRDAAGDLVCSHTPGGGYAPNAIHVISNMIVENSKWGVWEDAAPGVTQSLDNLYLGNTFEGNGHEADSGAMFLAFSRATQVIANYFEAGPQYIVIGGAGRVPATGVTVRGNYFTTYGGTPASIALVHAQDTMIEDNSQYDPLPNSPTPCFLELGLESGTFLGKNHIEAQSVACRGHKPAPLPAGVFDASGGADGIGRFVGEVTAGRAAAGESLPVEGLTAQGHCAAIAADAGGAALSGLYAEAGDAAVTVHHAPHAGGKVNVFCSAK